MLASGFARKGSAPFFKHVLTAGRSPRTLIFLTIRSLESGVVRQQACLLARAGQHIERKVDVIC